MRCVVGLSNRGRWVFVGRSGKVFLTQLLVESVLARGDEHDVDSAHNSAESSASIKSMDFVLVESILEVVLICILQTILVKY